MHDAHALAHFFHPHEIPIETVAHRADRDVELETLIAAVRMRLADVPFHARTAQVRSRDAEIDRVGLRQHPDVAVALDENLVPGQQFVRFIERRRKILQELPQHRQEIRRHVVGQSADPRVAGGKPRTADQFAQVVNLFAFAERPQKHRHGADVQGHRADAEQMRTDPRQFRADHPDVLAARRHLHAAAVFPPRRRRRRCWPAARGNRAGRCRE